MKAILKNGSNSGEVVTIVQFPGNDVGQLTAIVVDLDGNIKRVQACWLTVLTETKPKANAEKRK